MLAWSSSLLAASTSSGAYSKSAPFSASAAASRAPRCCTMSPVFEHRSSCPACRKMSFEAPSLCAATLATSSEEHLYVFPD